MAFLDSQGVSKLCALLKDKFDNVMSAVNRKQDALTAGANITINDGVISADGGSDYTAGRGIDIDANSVINKNDLPFIHSMLQMTTAGNACPNVVKLDNSSTWEQFVDNVKAGKVVYISTSTSYTFSESYKLTPALLGISNLYALHVDQLSVPMMSTSVASYPATGTQVFYSTYYYFDGAFLWSWKDPENLGNFIKVRYKNYKNYALGRALSDINTDISAKLTAPTDPSTDGTYKLTSTITSGTPTYSWETDSGSSGGNVNLTYGEYGIPIGLFYNTTKGYQSPYFARTPAILQLSAAPSARELASGQFIKTTNINNESTYNTVDIFPDATTNTCYKIQVKRDGIDWTNAQTISTSVGATFNLMFYGRGTIRVGNVIFYWLSRDQWSSNSNSVYDEDALQMIREELFPELFTSSSSSSLPAAPSADGNYILKCSVSSGTPTYSWESVTVGGSY